jgi:peptidoglycan/xylan/chitin deacetylase (PgdA/CDA1 family)
MKELYRDDDISVTSDCRLLREVHELFLKYNRIHTIAVLMKDIWDNKEVWYWLMTTPNLQIGLHGWTHKDYSIISEEEIRDDFNLCFEYWKFRISENKKEYIPIKTFFPPWNKISNTLIKVCAEFGLDLDYRKGGDVYNFHYWALYEPVRMRRLEEALK